MPWQVTDNDGVTDTYDSKRDVVSCIESAMSDDEYIEAARDWGWRIKEIVVKQKQEDA